MFQKVLIANRGAIACRINRTLRRMEVDSVAVYSAADRHSLHVRSADEAVEIGPAAAAQSYLSADALLRAAASTGAQAIHPGYGFLSENADFARACAAAGVVFIGPTPELLDLLGDKVAARALARESGVPVLSGSDSPVDPGPSAHAVADALGYPVIVKASMGGGGRGMRVVETSDALDQALDQARREALNAFGCAD